MPDFKVVMHGNLSSELQIYCRPGTCHCAKNPVGAQYIWGKNNNNNHHNKTQEKKKQDKYQGKKGGLWEPGIYNGEADVAFFLTSEATRTGLVPHRTT